MSETQAVHAARRRRGADRGRDRLVAGQPGDTVAVNDVIVEIETAKALVELPCPCAGTVSELLVRRGRDRRGRRADHRRRDGGRVLRRPATAGSAAGRARRGRRRDRRAGARPGGRAGPDRRAGPGRAHVGAGRLRPAHHRGQAPPPCRRPRRGPCPSPAAAPTPSVIKQAVHTPEAPAAAPACPGGGRPGAGQAAGAQAGQGPRRRPARGDPDRPGRRGHPRRRARPRPRARPSRRTT